MERRGQNKTLYPVVEPVKPEPRKWPLPDLIDKEWFEEDEDEQDEEESIIRTLTEDEEMELTAIFDWRFRLRGVGKYRKLADAVAAELENLNSLYEHLLQIHAYYELDINSREQITAVFQDIRQRLEAHYERLKY